MGLGFNSTTCWDHVALCKAKHFTKHVFPETIVPNHVNLTGHLEVNETMWVEVLCKLKRVV